MGQRGDNFMHAFDGWTLDWSAVFGLGFETAPDHWVSVYREASIEELVRIASHGVCSPSPDVRHPEMRQEMELLDKFRPPQVVEKGVSRLKAIYASPTPETPHLSFRRERAILEMRVDPEAGYVGEMDFITALIPFMNAHGRGLEKYQGAFRRYWDSVIPLGAFTKHYKPRATDDGMQWVRKSGPSVMPKTFFSPEIMVMSPAISKQHVRIVRWDPPEAEKVQEVEWWNDPEEQWGEV
jgi:hypothetical protein